MKKTLRIIISIISVMVIIAGGYVGNMFGLFEKGNYGEYCLTGTQANENSPLKGKTILFLGSSVTYGYGSLGVSFADFLERTDGITAIKEAVSGTTLTDIGSSSYISRMKKINKDMKIDALVCQLSTNDATKELPLGEISDSIHIDSFDTQTVTGALEYIIAYAKSTWDCTVIFYTQAEYDSEYYGRMVEILHDLHYKWNIHLIDLWNDAEINSISEEQRSLYLIDHIHPTKAGYKEWWLPKIQNRLYDIINYMT